MSSALSAARGCPGTISSSAVTSGVENRISVWPARAGRPGNSRIRLRLMDTATNSSPASAAVAVATAAPKLVQADGE